MKTKIGRLIRISEFRLVICEQGHYDPAGITRKTCRRCGAKMGKPASTLRLMAQQDRLLGAQKFGIEWLVDPIVAAKSKFNGRGAPKKKGVEK